MVSNNNQMLMCFESGDTELFSWNEEQNKLQRLDFDKSDEHEDKLTCCDILERQGLYVTGDKDGLVKIWNFKKQLIREVKFVEAVNSVCFLNQTADIIVGHSGNLSRLNCRDYMDRKLMVTPEELQEFILEAKDVHEEHFKKIGTVNKQDEDEILQQEQKIKIDDNIKGFIKNTFKSAS